MEVVVHNLRDSPSSLDGCGVDLEHLLGIDGTIILLGELGPELVGPVDLP